MGEKFKISRHSYTISFEKNDQVFKIFQTNDDDIWFATSQESMDVGLSFASRNYSEYQMYMIFEQLMKSIIGRYILTGDDKNEYSRLPKDFIDLENKVIIWHSDGESNSTLRFEYTDGVIRISIYKNINSKGKKNNSVRIRTDGSDYGCYYQEFTEFFKQLLMLEQRLNKNVEQNSYPKKEEKNLGKIKVLGKSIFKK